jgi:dolichyl-diphosphooligosaccharide--protein glycosyltransferase
MAVDNGSDFFFKGESGRNTRGLLRLIILVTIAAAAVAARLFSVIRFESIIHECTSGQKLGYTGSWLI